MSDSGEGAAKYFDAALAKGDYYTKDMGTWRGKGAKMLGLGELVTRDQFIALASTFDEAENRWKAGQFINLKADAPFYEAEFNARFAGKLIEGGYGIRRKSRAVRGWQSSIRPWPDNIGRTATLSANRCGCQT